MEFPYLLKYTEAASVWTPYCWIEIRTQMGTYRKHKFLFDTGADFTSVPKFMSTIVGFDLADAQQMIMYTANNEPMVTYRGSLSLRIDAQSLQIPCVFTDRDDTPFLLGRMGFIDRFEMLLSARKKSLTINRTT